MSKDLLQRAVEEAEKAAQNLKHELKRAKLLVDETRERLERPTVNERLSFEDQQPMAKGDSTEDA